jgi:hypothetical protein
MVRELTSMKRLTHQQLFLKTYLNETVNPPAVVFENLPQ